MTIKQRFAVLAIIALAVLLGSTVTFADTIGFTGGNGSTGTGTATYSPGGSFTISGAVITGLSIDGINFTVTSGLLNLTSGTTNTFSGCSGGPCSATFNGGGSLSANGAVTSLGISSVASLLSAIYLSGGSLLISGTTGAFLASLDPSSVSLNSAILSQLAGTYVSSGSNTEIDINLAFSGGTYSGSVSSSAATIVTAAAEPATAGLLGVGLVSLLALAGVRKKIRTIC